MIMIIRILITMIMVKIMIIIIMNCFKREISDFLWENVTCASKNGQKTEELDHRLWLDQVSTVSEQKAFHESRKYLATNLRNSFRVWLDQVSIRQSMLKVFTQDFGQIQGQSQMNKIKNISQQKYQKKTIMKMQYKSDKNKHFIRKPHTLVRLGEYSQPIEKLFTKVVSSTYSNICSILQEI